MPEYESVASDRVPTKSFCLLTPRPVEHPERVDSASNAVMNMIRRRVKWSTGVPALSVRWSWSMPFLQLVGPTGQMAFLVSRRKISAPIKTQRAATTVDAMLEEAEAMLPRSLAADAVVINASG